LALLLGVLGLGVLVAVLTGVVGRTTPDSPAPSPAVAVVAAIPTTVVAVPAIAGAADGEEGVNGSRTGSARAAYPLRHGSHSLRTVSATQPSSSEQRVRAARFVDQTEVRISRRWMEGFYPVYAVAQSTFGVDWLLIASIHDQESAFSTASSTYHGLNFARCCGGPMQFNVTNGPLTTWDLVSDSYLYGKRPAHYDHMTAHHPSVYDDFDSIMAAAHLLSADGAGYALNGAAWDAAYDYYGHDAAGVSYADQVLARAIDWSQHGFCVNCGVEGAIVEAVDAAYGAAKFTLLSAARGASRSAWAGP
jgi:hypothetical protein